MGGDAGASVGGDAGASVGGAVGGCGGTGPGAGVLTGLNALCASTPLGKLTDKITGAAHAAAWTTFRFVMPPSFFSAASAKLSSLWTCSCRASSSAFVEGRCDLAFFGSFFML